MDINVFFAVIFAAFLHAVWNAMVKNEENKFFALSAIVFGHVPASVVLIFAVPYPSIESIPYILLSALLHILYQWFLLSAYRVGDYTLVYPVARGTGPILATIFSLIFLGVILSNFELLGIFIISLGILSLTFQRIKSFRNHSAVIYALITGFFIMTYSITDGLGARISSSVMSYYGWVCILNALMLPVLLKIMKKTQPISKFLLEGKKLFFIGGTISYFVYLIVLWGFTQAPIAMVAALRETSIIIALLIGTLFLKERFTILKAVSILIIFVGIILLKFF